MTSYTPVVEVVPEGEHGKARVTHGDTRGDPSYLRYRVRDAHFREGRFALLTIDGDVWMSDTGMEQRTNSEFLYRAHGRVLLGGLGLGMVLPPILAKTNRDGSPAVTKVDVLEVEPDVIALVGQHYRDHRVNIIEANAYTWDWRSSGLAPWDVIYFDIWRFISEDNLPEMARLHRRYARALDRSNPQAWMGSWRQEDLRYWRRTGHLPGWVG